MLSFGASMASPWTAQVQLDRMINTSILPILYVDASASASAAQHTQHGHAIQDGRLV